MENLETEVDIINLTRRIIRNLEGYMETVKEINGIEKEFYKFLKDYINLKEFYNGEYKPTKKEVMIMYFSYHLGPYFTIEMFDIKSFLPNSLSYKIKEAVRENAFNTGRFGFNYFLKQNGFSNNEIEKIFSLEDHIYSNEYYKKILEDIEAGKNVEENTEKANNYLFSLMEFLEFAESLK